MPMLAVLFAVLGPELFVELVLHDELARGRHAALEFRDLLREDHRRMREPVIEEFRGPGAMLGRDQRRHIVLGLEAAEYVAGADAQLENDGRIRCLGKLETLFHHAHDRGQFRARIEQPQRRLERHGVRALLNDAGALAIVLADDDERAAHDAAGGQVGQCVSCDVCADDRLPGDGPAHRIIDRGGEHGGGGRLVGAGFDLDAELGQEVLGLHQHVEQMRDRRALVAADIGDARLQQRLGHGEDALAMESGAVAEAQALDFFSERNFHEFPARYSCVA